MGKIVLLDDLTINKIAAGEVIERPASCVKEMVENSIDAGSKNITVEIKNGGISFIKIVDDGSGISEDDMEMAFERHATSKIRNADDLEKVKTMGFRGEALASVAAISNVEMISKRPEDEIGHRIVVEGGKVLEKGEVGCPNRTSITVKNLFFNTPVRYKFLKKDFTESGYIEDAITRLALVNTDVAIKLINTGKTVIQTTGNGDITTVIYSIYGKDVSNGIVKVEYEFEDIKVKGVVGNTDIARSNRNGQICFVNNRYVKNKTISSAIDGAYKDILPTGKYGFVVLNIEIDPSKVDCNVHPAKLEVKFQDEQNVFKAVYHAIKSKNDDIIVKKAPKFSELENQEKIEEEKDEVLENDEEQEEFKPRNNVFSGFFKKFKSDKEDDENEKENTIIEDLFEARRKNESSWGKFDSDDEDEKDEKKEDEEIKENVKEEATEYKIPEVVVPKLEEEKLQETKIGNTVISSDTKESNYDINDLLKKKIDETTKNVDMTKILSSNDSKTEVVESLKKIEEEKNKETVVINTEDVRNEKNEEEVKNEIELESPVEVEKEETTDIEDNSITERIIEQKVNSDMEDTQLIDTEEVRSELKRLSQKEDIPMTSDFADMYKKVFGTEVQAVRKTKEEEDEKLDFSNNIQEAENIENESVFEKEEQKEVKEILPKIQYKYIGTIFDNFAIIEVKDEMYMIEKSAAEERLMYDVVKENFYNEENKDSVTLLLADIITLTQKEMSMARELKEMFEKSGFGFEEFGEYTLKLTKVPSWAESLNTKNLFLEILRDMDTVAVTATKEKEDKFISVVSNKYVALSDTKLTEEELKDLVKRLLTLSSPFMYPNGRLTSVKISKANMEKKFSRR